MANVMMNTETGEIIDQMQPAFPVQPCQQPSGNGLIDWYIRAATADPRAFNAACEMYMQHTLINMYADMFKYIFG